MAMIKKEGTVATMADEKRFVVSPQTIDYSINNIVEAIDKGNELLGLNGIEDLSEGDRLTYSDSIILKPSYQRDYRATIRDESSLVESILVGIPIPPVFLSSTRYRGVQVLDVVDGQHRLNAFYRFRNGQFQLQELELIDGLNNKSFADLSIEDKETFASHKLSAYVFRDFPGKKFELEVFNRYNKGTKALTPQEIRNAVYASPYNDFVTLFTKDLFNGKDEVLQKAYNVTRDRYLKKKVHEGIFTILWILEYGINTSFKDSTTYSEEYMKRKAEFCDQEPQSVDADLLSVRCIFNEFNRWIASCTSVTPYPFSKEIYGISSKSYKFQTSMAMILSAIYRKVFIQKLTLFESNEALLARIKETLSNSFLEDPEYNASSTNSFKISAFIESFD